MQLLRKIVVKNSSQSDKPKVAVVYT